MPKKKILNYNYQQLKTESSYKVNYVKMTRHRLAHRWTNGPGYWCNKFSICVCWRL